MNAVPISPSYAIEAMHPADWPVVQAIYQEGILAGTATFETQAPDWEAWDHAHLAIGRLVARETHGARAVAGLGRVEPLFQPGSLRRGGRGEHLRGRGAARPRPGPCSAGSADRAIRGLTGCGPAGRDLHR